MNRMISFGYGFADGKLSVIAEEAETVKGIFSDYVNGKILKEIADDLTARQVNFFNGKCSWNKNMIFRIIENGKYIGEDGYRSHESHSGRDFRTVRAHPDTSPRNGAMP